jgi:hypothetical protein
MVNMKRSFLAIGAAFGLLVPASASASIIELGATKTPLVAPVCPPGVSAANCTIILTQVTALETIRDSTVYPTTVSQAGELVAFTVGLSNLSTNRATRLSDIKFLDHTYGGTTQVAISVLHPTGPKRLRQYTVTAVSEIKHVQPFLGQVVQFPLATPLTVARNDVIALTTPTWAPVLSIQLATKKFAYRQSRTANCGNPPGTNQAMLTIGQSASFMCDYTGTRVEYTATEVTTPVPPANYVHAPDRWRSTPLDISAPLNVSAQ